MSINAFKLKLHVCFAYDGCLPCPRHRALIQHAPHRRHIIESTAGCLLMGEVMAALAECQNRQEMGVDSWVGVRHPGGRLYPVAINQGPWRRVLGAMTEDGVSVKVAVEKAFGAGEYPA